MHRQRPLSWQQADYQFALAKPGKLMAIETGRCQVVQLQRQRLTGDTGQAPLTGLTVNLSQPVAEHLCQTTQLALVKTREPGLKQTRFPRQALIEPPALDILHLDQSTPTLQTSPIQPAKISLFRLTQRKLHVECIGLLGQPIAAL